MGSLSNSKDAATLERGAGLYKDVLVGETGRSSKLGEGVVVFVLDGVELDVRKGGL